jgi:hypothetical protein
MRPLNEKKMKNGRVQLFIPHIEIKMVSPETKKKLIMSSVFGLLWSPS